MRGRENKRKISVVSALAVCFLMTGLFAAPRAKSAGRAFAEKFNKRGSIEESGSMEESASDDWWVNSGGEMNFRKGVGQTIQKNLSKNSKWRKIYNETNPEDTDNGKHPQNIFRLVTKTRWQNFSQQTFFKIKKSNLSASENRNESNGILLFNRYLDADNLYYAGVRVDGHAVIKKKLDGEYFTLAYEKFYAGKKYNPKSHPNLLPAKKSIGLKTEVQNTENGKVSIKLYVASGRKGKWVLAAEAADEPRKYGEEVISSEGYAGIRTDFMDVEFDKYRIAEF